MSLYDLRKKIQIERDSLIGTTLSGYDTGLARAMLLIGLEIQEVESRVSQLEKSLEDRPNAWEQIELNTLRGVLGK